MSNNNFLYDDNKCLVIFDDKQANAALMNDVVVKLIRDQVVIPVFILKKEIECVDFLSVISKDLQISGF